MSKPRFSKRAVTDYCDRRIENIQDAHKFDLGRGWAQIAATRHDVTRSELDVLIARAVEYGRLRAFEDVANAVEEGL